MEITKKKLTLILIGVFFAGAILMGAVCAAMMHSPGFGLANDDKLAEIQKNIEKYYLEDYDEENLMNGAYAGYVEGLGDPYSTYMTPEQYSAWEASATGQYSGVGITFSENKDGYFEAVSINPDSPADKAGIEPGDLILEVDGKTYTDSELMAADIRGKKGTEVTLLIVHDDEEKEITLVRDDIKLASVDWEMLDDGIAHIEINSFVEETGEDFSNALSEIEAKDARGLILDLRNNGGGLVDQSVEVADKFLDEGVVCYIEDKDGNTDTYNAEDGKTDIPTVVLVNEYSASSSEILAAALKDNGYEIVGTKSFGKGIIQTTINLDDGSALKLTILRYLSPDKHAIHKKGVKPTVKVKDKEKTEADEQLEKAIELLK